MAAAGVPAFAGVGAGRGEEEGPDFRGRAVAFEEEGRAGLVPCPHTGSNIPGDRKIRVAMRGTVRLTGIRKKRGRDHPCGASTLPKPFEGARKIPPAPARDRVSENLEVFTCD